MNRRLSGRGQAEVKLVAGATPPRCLSFSPPPFEAQQSEMQKERRPGSPDLVELRPVVPGVESTRWYPGKWVRTGTVIPCHTCFC